jgi:hypothetical protein
MAETLQERVSLGGVVHFVLVAGYFDTPRLNVAQTSFNWFFIFVLFLFWAGSHKCELKTNRGGFRQWL